MLSSQLAFELGYKVAKLLPDVPLQPHQQRVVEKTEDDPQTRLLLYHGLGSGKTRAAISAAETAGQPYAAIMPAALRSNFRGEVAKWTDQSLPHEIASYTAMARGAGPTQAATVILDEPQRLRNPEAKQTKAVQQLAERAQRVYLLSGTPVVNRPGDLAPLLEMLTRKQMSPEQFEDRFVGTKQKWPGLIGWLRGIKPVTVPALKNESELKSLLAGHVDYNGEPETGIKRQDQTHVVEMSPQQARLYRGFWGQLPWLLRWKLQNDFPMTNKELANLNAFFAGPRQVSLSTYPFMKGYKDPAKAFEQSPKLQKALQLVQAAKAKDPQFRGAAFSNFIEAGLVPYQAALERSSIPAAIFHGGLSDAEKKQLVQRYNAGQLQMGLFGPAGAEGISLKGSKLLQILDPHFHAARTRQQIGRGIRFDSHALLPEADRNVVVQRFKSRLPTGFFAKLWRRLTNVKPDDRRTDPGTDDYLEHMSSQKDQINNEILRVLREVGST